MEYKVTISSLGGKAKKAKIGTKIYHKFTTSQNADNPLSSSSRLPMKNHTF